MFDDNGDEFSGSTALDGLDALGPDGLLTVIEGCGRRVAALQARQVAAVAASAAARAGSPLAEFVPVELGFVLRLSPNAAQDRLHVAGELAGRLRETLRLLAAGGLDYYRARCVVDAVAGLDDDTAAAVQARVLPNATERTATQLKAALRRAVLAMDPAGAERRHAAARRERRVEFRPAADGMAWLNVTAPADDAALVYSALDGLARAARRSPAESRTLDQLRADVLVEIARAIVQGGGWTGCGSRPGAVPVAAGPRCTSRSARTPSSASPTSRAGWVDTGRSRRRWRGRSPRRGRGGGSSPTRSPGGWWTTRRRPTIRGRCSPGTSGRGTAAASRRPAPPPPPAPISITPWRIRPGRQRSGTSARYAAGITARNKPVSRCNKTGPDTSPGPHPPGGNTNTTRRL
ncbi:MAG: DUF222 domain-containing protein [Frankiaceae bacterium]